MTTFSDKFIAFVDVLGFKSLVAESERGTGMPLTELLTLLQKLGTGRERSVFDEFGPTCCPMASCVEKNLDFRVTQISDCVIVSSEVSPAGVINLISHCWGAVINLMSRGIMCRGYIRRGSIFHTDTQVIGSGYQDAYSAESRVSAFKREADERGTPYVEIDPEITDYVDRQSDSCVRMMFDRMVKRDGNTVVLYPFQRLNHSFVISGWGHKFEPEKELASNENVRKNLLQYIENVRANVDPSDKSAMMKANHYVEALRIQLNACDETDRAIRMLASPISR
jgi:phage-related protein